MVTVSRFDREKLIGLVASMICSDNELAVDYIGRWTTDRHSAAVDRVSEILQSVFDGIPEIDGGSTEWRENC